jgi:hypothetical protein
MSKLLKAAVLLLTYFLVSYSLVFKKLENNQEKPQLLGNNIRRIHRSRLPRARIHQVSAALLVLR